MPTTSDYLEQLEQDREDLVDNLETKGISGLTGDETFTELVPEVLNISGGGGSSHNWSAIGYSEEPQSITDDYNYAKDIYDNWDNTQTDLTSKFEKDSFLSIMPLVDTSNATNMYKMFSICSALSSVPMLNTSNVTNMGSMFSSCPKLITIPQFNTSKNKTMASMFSGCTMLGNLPVLNTSKVSGTNSFQNAFSNCPNLTDTSLDNILQMCINATSYSATKTLARLGFNATNYPASRIQALPHYQNFIDAGWAIGY